MRILGIILAYLAFTAATVAQTNVQEIISDGGIKAWVVDEPSIPFVAIEISFKGGTSLDSSDKAGATYLMTGLLEEGAGDLDATAFLRETERLAASFGFDAGRDSVSISAQVLTQNRDEALGLLKKALLEPSFSDVAFARVKEQVTSIVTRDLAKPRYLASQKLNSLLYGAHPYARAPEGSLETVKNLTQDDMRAALKYALVKDRMFVSVVGDIRASEVGAMLDNLLGGLPQSGGSLPQKTDVMATGGVSVIDYDTPQSVAVWAQAGIERHHPDFFPAYVLNHILGGSGFTSRLTQEVREKRGLTYGVYSYLAPYDYASVYGGSVSSANDRIKTAIEVIQDEWRIMAETGISEQELDEAKKYLTGAYPLRFDGNGRIANMLVGMQMENLPIEYPLTRNDKVNAVTMEQVNSVAKWLLKPDDLRFVIVGKPVGLSSTD